MEDERREYLKVAAGAGVAGASTLLTAKFGIAKESQSEAVESNGVVIGHSPKKEILYKKTQHWELYYKVAY